MIKTSCALISSSHAYGVTIDIKDLHDGQLVIGIHSKRPALVLSVGPRTKFMYLDLVGGFYTCELLQVPNEFTCYPIGGAVACAMFNSNG